MSSLLLLIVVGAGARYSRPDRDPPSFRGLSSIKTLASSAGYSSTDFEVITEDGYSLWLHRIGSSLGPPVLLLHGIFLAGDSWISGGPNKGLAFLLLERGYDVWLGNQRGTVYNEYSLEYQRFNPKFWDFSFHEAGMYDLPAVIDTILDVRGVKQVFYIAHSLGTTVFLTMASSRPEYNSKIAAAVLLSPVAYTPTVEELSPLLRIGSRYIDFVYKAGSLGGVYEFLGRSEGTIKALRQFCTSTSHFQTECFDLFGIAFGEHRTNIDKEAWDGFIPYYFAGTSFKTFIHAGQLFQSGDFAQFDYGAVKNLLEYGSKRPPSYPVRRITAPIALFWGNNDPLLSATSVGRLVRELPNLIFSREQGDPCSAHLDLILGADNNETLYPYILNVLETVQ